MCQLDRLRSRQPKPTSAKSVRKMSAKSITMRPALGVDAEDRQRHQDRVGVVLLDRLLQRRARRRLVVDVLADELDVVADPVEAQDPLIAEIQRLAGHGRSPRDHDRRQDRLLELVRLDLGVKMLIFLIERDEALVLLGPFGQFREVLKPGGLTAAMPGLVNCLISIAGGSGSAGSCMANSKAADDCAMHVPRTNTKPIVVKYDRIVIALSLVGAALKSGQG